MTPEGISCRRTRKLDVRTCREEEYFCPTFFCQQGTWSAARIQLIVRGRRLVHSMLRSPWHNMHAQRGSELGNGTADEHSGTLMRASTDRTSRSRWAAANPSLIGGFANGVRWRLRIGVRLANRWITNRPVQCRGNCHAEGDAFTPSCS
jgi:hypothetical protein